MGDQPLPIRPPTCNITLVPERRRRSRSSGPVEPLSLFHCVEVPDILKPGPPVVLTRFCFAPGFRKDVVMTCPSKCTIEEAKGALIDAIGAHKSTRLELTLGSIRSHLDPTTKMIDLSRRCKKAKEIVFFVKIGGLVGLSGNGGNGGVGVNSAPKEEGGHEDRNPGMGGNMDMDNGNVGMGSGEVGNGSNEGPVHRDQDDVSGEDGMGEDPSDADDEEDEYDDEMQPTTSTHAGSSSDKPLQSHRKKIRRVRVPAFRAVRSRKPAVSMRTGQNNKANLKNKKVIIKCLMEGCPSIKHFPRTPCKHSMVVHAMTHYNGSIGDFWNCRECGAELDSFGASRYHYSTKHPDVERRGYALVEFARTLPGFEKCFKECYGQQADLLNCPF